MTNTDRIKKIHFRCWHRGTKEMDLILGRFIDSVKDQMNDNDLNFMETLLDYPDDSIYRWITGRETTYPEELQTNLFHDLLDFYKQK